MTHDHKAYKCKNEKFRTVHQSGKMFKQQQQMLTDEKKFHDMHFFMNGKENEE